MGLFESRERRKVRKIRRALDRFVAAMIRLYARTWDVAGGKQARPLIVLIEDHVEVLVADLAKIERELRVGRVDLARVKAVNSSFRDLKRQIAEIDRSLRHQAGVGSRPAEKVTGWATNGNARARWTANEVPAESCGDHGEVRADSLRRQRNVRSRPHVRPTAP